MSVVMYINSHQFKTLYEKETLNLPGANSTVVILIAKNN